MWVTFHNIGFGRDKLLDIKPDFIRVTVLTSNVLNPRGAWERLVDPLRSSGIMP
jgi:hypothetical protein